MIEHEYKFIVSPERRKQAFLYVFLTYYPALVCRFLFRRKPDHWTLFYLLFSPWLVLRQIINALMARGLFCGDIEYRLRLYDSHVAFGAAEDEDKMLAGSFGSIRHFFECNGDWNFITHDGWFVHLPPKSEGDAVRNSIQKKWKVDGLQNARTSHPT